MGYFEWLAAEQDLRPQSTGLARLKTAVLEQFEYQLIQAVDNAIYMKGIISQVQM